jgi:hypothetical protein
MRRLCLCPMCLLTFIWCVQDMLDLSYGSCDTSRLGCQLKLRDDMQGLVVTVPAQANNLMDHIPFPDN